MGEAYGSEPKSLVSHVSKPGGGLPWNQRGPAGVTYPGPELTVHRGTAGSRRNTPLH